MINPRKLQVPFATCLDCDEPMMGIFSYTIRETCSGCGGHAIMDRPEPEEHRGRITA